MESSAGTGPASTCVYLGIKVRPGPIERHRLDDFPLHNTVTALKQQAESKANVPSDALDVIHHGKILKDEATLSDSGVRAGETLHVVRRRSEDAPAPPPSYTDAELQDIVAALRSFGCTPTAHGWTRAMQVLNSEARMEEILSSVPGLDEDCITISMLHEIELLAALGATPQTMRRGAAALPALPAALRSLVRLVRAQPVTPTADPAVPTSGFAYSLEALSEDEDVDVEDEDEEGARRPPITQEQFAAALRMAQQNVVASSRSGDLRLLRLLQGSTGEATGDAAADPDAEPTPGGSRNIITSDMFSNAVIEAMNRVSDVEFTAPAGTPMDQSTAASSSQSPAPEAAEEYSAQLRRMREVGLLDDALNMRALLICGGDVNAAINFVFASMEE